MVDFLWAIPLVPLAVSLLVLASSRKLAAALAIAGQTIALLLSIAAFHSTMVAPGHLAVRNFTWFHFGDQTLRLGLLLDPLTAVMLVMITFVALCIFVFSVGYMAADKNFGRFFAYLSFFTAAMLGVVVANSLLLVFICWELVGLASYLLIGFWIEKPSAAAAAKKAFITTRIGDLGFFLGLLWLYRTTGTTLFYGEGGGAFALLPGGSTAIALLIFCGAVGKSGQFPLHVWLPDAMEGPTPVSALIHAATMVAAGVFLVARSYPLFTAEALQVVVWVGVLTAFIAALIGLAQFDLKRILAYSTVSQLGLMMVSLGVGGVSAGILHLLAHGFFKALLFLGAGSVIHGTHHEQDIRKMGGLRGAMPLTFFTYAIGMMALSGVPLFFAGAWTKEEILHATAAWPVSRLPYYFTMAGVVLTSLYMTRQMIFVFFGQRRGGEAHESPRVMTGPLILLAVCTVALSALLTPAWPWLHAFLLGEPASFRPGEFIQPALFVSLLLVALGIGSGLLFYRGAGERDPLQTRFPALFRFLENRMWLDELYALTVIALARAAAAISSWMDRFVWDGAVRAVAGCGKLAGTLSKGADEHGFNAAGDLSAASTGALGRLFSRLHSGQVQGYLGALAVGMLALLLLFAWLA